MIITSETEVSFSLEVKDESRLNELQRILETEFFNENISEINNVEIQKDLSLIHCIGQSLESNYQTHLAYALIALTGENIKIHHI
jgi:aspartokinase